MVERRWTRWMRIGQCTTFLILVLPRSVIGQPPTNKDDTLPKLLDTVLHGSSADEAVRAGLELAKKYQATNDFGRAEAVLREMVKRYPTCRPAEVMFELGYLLFNNWPRRPESIYYFRRAVAEGRDNPSKAAQAQLFAAYVYGEYWDLEQAGREFDELKKQFPNERRRVAQATMDFICFRHWQPLDPEGLLKEAQQARKDFGDWADVAGTLDLISGRLLAGMGRYEEALPLFQRVPKDLNFPAARGVDARQEIVRCYLQMNQPIQARSALDSLVQEFPGATQDKQVSAFRDLIAKLSAGAACSLKIVVRDKENAKPVGKALVSVSSKAGDFWLNGYTDTQGAITLGPLARGEINLSAEAAGFEKVYKTLSLPKDGEITAVEFDMPGSKDRPLRLRLLSADGQPCRDADVQVWMLSEEWGGNVRCDHEGMASLRHMPRGGARFDIALRMPDSGVVVFDVTKLKDGAEVRLQPGAALDGQMGAGGDKDSAFGIILDATLQKLKFFAVTDDKGHVALRCLPPGEYVISAQPSKGFAAKTSSQKSVLKENATTTVQLHLQ